MDPSDDPLSPVPKVPDAAALAEEERLWNEILADPEDQERHKAYMGFIARNNLLKEASRRYGPMISAKDDYSIEARRQFRQYQQTIVNMMFMTSPRHHHEVKKSEIDYFLLFVGAVLIVFGIAGPMISTNPIIRYGLLLGLVGGIAIVGFSIYKKVQLVKTMQDDNNPTIR